MEYKYAQDDNFEDFASGRVLYHRSKEPTFPVRLTLEIFERCRQYSTKKTDIHLYDCCCGGGYMLTILGLLKNKYLSKLYGSDIDEKSLKLAADNLSLLTESGMNKRRSELEALYKNYGKASHIESLHSIDRIEKLLSKRIETHVFEKNVFEIDNLSFLPDIIITDVPYGNMAHWQDGSGSINDMMSALSGICKRDTTLCICMDKKQKIKTDIFQRLEKQQIGKRKFEIYKKKIFGTLSCAREYAEADRLDEWVQLFLRGDGKNIKLADGLAESNFKYMGIFSIHLTDLDVTRDVPEYLTDANDIKWFNDKVDDMINNIRSGWDMPPLIVHYQNGRYHPMDGRHRNVALHKAGIKDVPAVIAVNTEEDYHHFMERLYKNLRHINNYLNYKSLD